MAFWLLLMDVHGEKTMCGCARHCRHRRRASYSRGEGLQIRRGGQGEGHGEREADQGPRMQSLRAAGSPPRQHNAQVSLSAVAVYHRNWLSGAPTDDEAGGSCGVHGSRRRGINQRSGADIAGRRAEVAVGRKADPWPKASSPIRFPPASSESRGDRCPCPMPSIRAAPMRRRSFAAASPRPDLQPRRALFRNSFSPRPASSSSRTMHRG